jgi:uncharacterized surface protein with fasciclin (FAS1) repeats
MTRPTLTRLAALGLASVLVLAACGDDDDDAAATTEAAEETTTEPEQTTRTEAEAEAEAAGTIVDIAAGDPDFSTLVTAVQAAGLAETLSGPGPYTVFAPTNAAFNALPAGTLDTLLADPQGALTPVLTYHVVEGAVMSSDLASGQVPTVNGAPVDVVVNGGAVTVNGANVVTADIEASNGVMHVVDAALVPPSA